MLIRSGNVELRSFEPSLTDTVLEMRNHASVRAHMRDPAPISREAHYKWVQENLVEARHVVLFVVFSGGEAVGLTLLRNFKDEAAEIGVMVVDAARRPLVSYIASHLTVYYSFEILGLEKLYSYVPRHNEHARTYNLNFGFEPSGSPNEVYHELVFTEVRYRDHPTHMRFREKHAFEVLEGA